MDVPCLVTATDPVSAAKSVVTCLEGKVAALKILSRAGNPTKVRDEALDRISIILPDLFHARILLREAKYEATSPGIRQVSSEFEKGTESLLERINLAFNQ